MTRSIDLARAIYPLECVVQAAEAFAGLCAVRVVSESSLGLNVEILAPDAANAAIEELVPEFLNYLLDVSSAFHLSRA